MAGTSGETDKENCVWERLLLWGKEGETLVSCLNKDLVPLGSQILSRRLVGEAKLNATWCFCRLACPRRPDLREQVVYMHIKIPTFIFKYSRDGVTTHRSRDDVHCKFSSG